MFLPSEEKFLEDEGKEGGKLKKFEASEKRKPLGQFLDIRCNG